MKEKDDNLFYDISGISETSGIRERATVEYMNAAISKEFSDIKISEVSINESGVFKNKAADFLAGIGGTTKIEGLPPYVSVKINHKTEKNEETIVIWSPLEWNERFVGCPGGGTSVGGERYITAPNNVSRGMTMAKGIINHFTAATTDGGAKTDDWAFDENGKLDFELIENWRAASTHFMTLIGKRIAEILHGKAVKYSYLHGGSGGGRQCMVEAQEFPEDYDGIWASCPAINWSKFLMMGLWATAVMNSVRHYVGYKKMNFFMRKVHDSVGGKEKYYKRQEKTTFNPFSLVGEKIGNDVVTQEDAEIVEKIWNGPKDDNGNTLVRAHRPGVQCWNKILPVGAFWYPLFSKKPKPFFLAVRYARWATENPNEKFDDITIEKWYELYEKSVEKFANCLASSPDLSAFKNRGGKLMIDHGIDDPLIPVDNTIDYYEKLIEFFGKSDLGDFVKLYITPGDGHGTCSWHGPGITDKDGMTALISWVEKGIAPASIRTVLVDRSGETLQVSEQQPYCSENNLL